MAEDLEVGVMLEVDESQLEDVEDRQVNVTGGGGGASTPAQRDQQESIVAGGVSKGVAAAGLIGALSQLKSITALLGGLAGIVSRTLVPAVEVIADILRPIVSGINDFISDPVEFVGGSETEQAIETTLDLGQFSGVGAAVPGLQAISGIQKLAEGENNGAQTNTQNNNNGTENANNFNPLGDVISELQNDPSRTADQSGEANKQQTKNIIEDVFNDVLGGGNSQ